MAANIPATTTKPRPNRLPAPALFVGPSSANASAHSLARPLPTASNSYANSKPGPATQQPSRPSSTRHAATPPLTPRQTASHPSQLPQSQFDLNRSSPTTRPRASRASLEAQWSELQRTLNEVEQTAPASRATGKASSGPDGGAGAWAAGATVFGARHTEALTRLREAQIKLAEAWGPIGRDDDDGGVADHDEELRAKDREGRRSERDNAADDDDDEGDDAEQQQERRRRDGESDLRIAAERRQRNDEYFAKVKAGVQDVVAKLGEVSKAMKQVESEGREIWEDNSSVGATSRAETGLVTA